MRRVFRFFIAVLVFSWTLTLFVSAALAQVVINEILADPARDWDGDGVQNFRDDEWIEIVNLGDTSVDLDGYRLADGDGEPVWRYGFSGVLESGGVRAVYGSESTAWEESFGFPVYGLSLNNTGDRVTLYFISGGDTLPVDTYSYGDNAAEDDRSVGRGAASTGTWTVFDAYNPCNDKCEPPGNGCVPSPGMPNDCITGTRPVSWGGIKKRYRGNAAD